MHVRSDVNRALELVSHFAGEGASITEALSCCALSLDVLNIVLSLFWV